MTDEALAVRIARIEDREAIRNLCSRYSLAVDDHDFDTLAALFAPDALYGWVGQPPQAEGRAGTIALLRSPDRPRRPELSRQSRHDCRLD